ncbi:hypothetical protein DYB37_011474 [Aphanomyces astaci]|uniref:CRAL-TRIO domain-containing protein n=1 Tax=Aphanomyces astaci TaxID=112090 RepID=A0A418DRW1_APHAT|nr:hypothetical protein DYB35_011185 [Aphanomyces astaci]RHZ29523.1 hypothetical protein DYB37_011474 [Aphanomyces astaci]
MADTGKSGGDLDALLQEHKVTIDALRQRLGDALTDEYDDIWLLRFVLSNGSADAAEEPCRFTIQWRKDRHAMLAKIKSGQQPPLHHEVTKFQESVIPPVASAHKSTSLGEPVFYVRIGLCNPQALMDAVAFDDVVEYYMLYRENLLVQCDQESRKQRTLVKMLSVLDFTGFSIARGHDTRFSQMLGATSKLSEKMYPQLVGRTIFVNAPSIFQWVFRFIKPLLSQRTVAKIVMCPGQSSGQALAACPFANRYLGVEVSPGSTQSLDYPVGAGMRVSFKLVAEGKIVDVQAFVTANARGTNNITNNVTVLWERPELQASDGAQQGTWMVPVDGTLTLKIDNRHAMFRGRSIKFKLDFAEGDQL